MRLHPVLLFVLLTPAVVCADEIKFPEEELARETVLPIFDRQDSVQNRTVVTAGRIEIGPFGGWTMTDAFFNQLSAGLYSTYHFNEVHGINFAASMRFGGASSYSDQLNNVQGHTPLHLEYAPSPRYLGMLNYQFTAYYGKLSLTKLAVGNISIFGLAGVGLMGIGDGSYPTLNLGIGQKYYFSPSFALRADLIVMAYQGPDILSSTVNLSTKTETQPSSAFPKKTLYGTMMTLGAVYLLPGS